MITEDKKKTEYGRNANTALIKAVLAFLCLVTTVGIAACGEIQYSKEIKITTESEISAGSPSQESAPENCATISETEETEESEAAQEPEIPNREMRYFISQLDDEMLHNFYLMYDAARNQKTCCDFDEKISLDELETLRFALKFDCPELFNVDDLGTYYMEGEALRNISSVTITYGMNYQDYQERLEKTEKKISEIADSVSGNDSEKCRGIYEYLTNNCTYNSETANCGNAYGAIIENAAKCDGVSLAYKWILEQIGVKSYIDSGRKPDETEGHAWNIVETDGEYFATDVTADLMNYKSDKCKNWYPAYNVSTDWINDIYILNEVPEMFEVKSNHDMSHSYHFINGTFCEEYSYDVIYDSVDAAYKAEDSTTLLQFGSAETYEAFIDNYEQIVSDWVNENECSVEYGRTGSEEYRTVQLIVTGY